MQKFCVFKNVILNSHISIVFIYWLKLYKIVLHDWRVLKVLNVRFIMKQLHKFEQEVMKFERVF